MPLFREPEVLIYGMFLLLAAFFLGYFLVWRLRKKQAWLYSDERLLERPPWWARLAGILAIAAVFAGTSGGMLALARPQDEDIDVKTYEEKRSGCLVPDHSGSMGMALSGGGQSKVKVTTQAQQRFVEKRGGDRLCIVPFESEVIAEFVMPLTDDTAALKQRLEELGGVVRGGTEMGVGMFYALAMLIQDALPEGEELDLKLFLREVSLGYGETAAKEQNSERQKGRPYVLELLRRTGGLRHAYLIVSTDAETGTSRVNHLGVLEVAARLGLRVYILGVEFDVTSFPDLTLWTRRTQGNVYFAKRAQDVDTLLEEINQLEKRKTLTRIVRHPRELAPEIMAFSVPLGMAGIFLQTLLVAGPSFLRMGARVFGRSAKKGDTP